MDSSVSKFPAEDEAQSPDKVGSSRRHPAETGNVETLESNEDPNIMGLPYQAYLKDSGRLANSFSKYSNHNL